MSLSSNFINILELFQNIKFYKVEQVAKNMPNADLVVVTTTPIKAEVAMATYQKFDLALIKVAGDIGQTIVLKPLYGAYGLGFAVDMGLSVSGNSLGDLLVKLYTGDFEDANQFGYDYIYSPGGVMTQGGYMHGEYFRIKTYVDEYGNKKIYRRPQDGHLMYAEVVSESIYKATHPDGNDLMQQEIKNFQAIHDFKNSFDGSHVVNEKNGVFYVTFPDGHIEAKNIENINTTLSGGNANDILVGGDNDDILIGNGGNDYMEGGKGFDTYYANGGDTIYDSDGKGRVYFENTLLGGGELNEDSGVYEGSGGVYTLSGSTLTFTKDDKTLTIKNYSKEDELLGIRLKDRYDEDDDEPELPNVPGGNSDGNFASPLVLDLNNNGITSVNIDTTNTLFDLNNNLFKQNTAWIESGDGLLVLDKNGNDIIDDGSELFGNMQATGNIKNLSDALTLCA